MDKGNVLIFNPVHIEGSKEVSKFINGETGCKCTVVEDEKLNSVNSLSRPDLIFVYLQCCEQHKQGSLRKVL